MALYNLIVVEDISAIGTLFQLFEHDKQLKPNELTGQNML
jgi:hypothetical protein